MPITTAYLVLKSTFNIHRRNLKSLALEMCKLFHNLSPSFTREFLFEKNMNRIDLMWSNVVVNNKSIPIPKSLNCKFKNVVYLWLCNLCTRKEAYFGRTIQQCRDRSSGHRKCFNELNWKKSALSMHAKDRHKDNFSLKKLFSCSC